MEQKEKEWGFSLTLLSEKDSKLKRIVILPGKTMEKRKHSMREEHLFFQKGKAVISSAGQDQIMEKGDSIDIPRNTIHSISNYGDEELIIIEIQTGEYISDYDIENVDEDGSREKR